MQLGVFLSEILKKKRRLPLLVLTSSPPPAQVFLPFPHRRNWQLVTNARLGMRTPSLRPSQRPNLSSKVTVYINWIKLYIKQNFTSKALES